MFSKFGQKIIWLGLFIAIGILCHPSQATAQDELTADKVKGKAKAQYAEALTHYRMQRYGSAIEVLDKLLKSKPKLVDAWLLRANAYLICAITLPLKPILSKLSISTEIIIGGVFLIWAVPNKCKKNTTRLLLILKNMQRMKS
ncbi:MAG: tetratricopeptide repeat protein [Saprospiraceae bacterium]|nr:tetratricopeptide repeat protein [Saprospiraceae bacterium]